MTATAVGRNLTRAVAEASYNPTDESYRVARNWPFTVHILKTWQPYFGHVRSGAKTFEVRRNDRDYQPGDLLILAEWDGDWTGQDTAREITYVLRGAEVFGLRDGFVVLALGSPRKKATADV